MRFGRVLVLLLFGLCPLWVAAACSDDAAGERLCEPGSEIFCRCRGGAAGTKTCREDGQGFDQCYAFGGPCEETIGSTTGSSTGSSSSSASGKDLLEPCEKGSECKSQSCQLGYCTMECAAWPECQDEEKQIFGDCVQLGGTMQVCVPYCGSQSDCDKYGAPSKCAYLPAVDAFFVTVCADFPGDPPLPPDGAECVDDWDCHLGHAGYQRVCELGQCLGGCHEPDDCPEGHACTPGTPGSCVPNG